MEMWVKDNIFELNYGGNARDGVYLLRGVSDPPCKWEGNGPSKPSNLTSQEELNKKKSIVYFFFSQAMGGSVKALL